MTLSADVAKNSMSLRALGFGFWQAWSLVTYTSGFLNSGQGAVLSGAEQIDASALMMLSLIGLILTVILLPLYKRTDSWLITHWFPLTGGALAAVSTLVVCCVFAGLLADPALFYFACFVAGIGNGMLCLAYGPVIGSLPPRESFLAVCKCMVLCCVIYFVSSNAPFGLCCAFCVVIPLISGILASFGRTGSNSAAEEIMQRVSLTVSSVRFFVAMLIIGGAASFIRSPFLASNPLASSVAIWDGLGTFIVLLVSLALVLLYQLTGKSCRAGVLYYSISLLIIAFLVANLIVVENGNQVMAAVLAECSSVPRLLMNVAFDTIIFYIIYQSKMSPAKTMGISHGFKSVGIWAGSQLGFLLTTNAESAIALTCIVIFCVVVALVLIAPEKVLSIALIPIDDHDADPASLALDEVEGGEDEDAPTAGDAPGSSDDQEASPADNAAGSEEAVPKGKRLWHRRCQLVSDQFQLSPREREVLGLLSLGHGSEYISEQLVISLYTARTHVRNIYGKTGVHSREELIQLIKTTEVDPTAFQR